LVYAKIFFIFVIVIIRYRTTDDVTDGGVYTEAVASEALPVKLMTVEGKRLVSDNEWQLLQKEVRIVIRRLAMYLGKKR